MFSLFADTLGIFVLSSIFAILAILARIVYFVHFHPLSKYPGPWLWAAFRWPMLLTLWRGVLPFRVKELHDRYGPVVRLGPDELSFLSADAWKDIYSNREYNRPPQWRGRYPGATADSLISAHSTDHARLRKVFAPAFSEKAVRGYEPDIRRLMDVFIDKLRTKMTPKKDEAGTESEATVDIMRWINFLLFDVMMDIGWSRPFGLLEKGDYHPWVTAMQGYEERILGVCFNYYPVLRTLAMLTMPEAAKKALHMIRSIAEDNVSHRLRMKTERADVFANTLGSTMSLEAAGISYEEMCLNSMTYVVVGSEPVTTVTAGILNYLLRDHSGKLLACLTDEIRSAVPDKSLLSNETTQGLPFLNAVLKEGMRLCPPIPDCMRRAAPVAGANIAGHMVPPNTTVSVSCWAMFASESHFERAPEFIPERWLERPIEPKGLCVTDFDDAKGVFYPFSYGPRGCLGQTLAWMELRLVLCRLLLEFDIRTPQDEAIHEWNSQRILWEWDRKPLQVTLRERS